VLTHPVRPNRGRAPSLSRCLFFYSNAQKFARTTSQATFKSRAIRVLTERLKSELEVVQVQSAGEVERLLGRVACSFA
jgi:hypothetical protein